MEENLIKILFTKVWARLKKIQARWSSVPRSHGEKLGGVGKGTITTMEVGNRGMGGSHGLERERKRRQRKRESYDL